MKDVVELERRGFRRAVLAAFAGAIGSVVLMAHRAGYDIVARGFVEGAVTTKPATAFALVWLALAMILASGFGTSKVPKEFSLIACVAAVLSILEPWLLLAVGVALRSIDTSVEFTVAPGVPSLSTAACVLLTFVGVTFRRDRVVARILAAVCSVALLGHALGVPLMYFYVPPWSTGMAIPTAFGFLALSLGFSLPRGKT